MSPCDVTEIAIRNSTKSNKYSCFLISKIRIFLPISPELSVSNVLKTCEQNLSALPVG
jgi:hypothetical protein